MRRKSLLLLLIFCILIFSLASCKEKDREYVESEVVAAAESLIEKSLILNEIYWGAGIRYEMPEDEDADVKGYLPADQEHLAELEKKYGIKDLETLKSKTREVFSEQGYQWILSSCLTNVTGDDEIVSYARYYQSKTIEEIGTTDGLMVYTGAINIYKNTKSVEYIYTGMHVLDVEGQVITVSLQVKTEGLDGKSTTRPFTVQLIEEASGWRLHGASYATHPTSAS